MDKFLTIFACPEARRVARRKAAMHCRLVLFGLTVTALTPSYSGARPNSSARTGLDQGGIWPAT